MQVCEFGGDDCIKAPSVVDRMAHKYSDRLVQRVEAIYNQLKEPCNLLDLPPAPTPPPPTRRRIVRIKQTLQLKSTSLNLNQSQQANQMPKQEKQTQFTVRA